MNSCLSVQKKTNLHTLTFGTHQATISDELTHTYTYFFVTKDDDYVVVSAKGKLHDSVKRVESIIDADKSKVHQRIVRL